MRPYEFGDFIFEVPEGRLYKGKDDITPAPTQVKLLGALLVSAPNFVSPERLRQEVWGNVYIGAGNLKTQILNLKNTLDPLDSNRFIEGGRRGVGYRFKHPLQPRMTDTPIFALRPEIESWLGETNYSISPLGEYLPIYSAYAGLDKSEVAVEDRGEYKPTEDFVALIERFPPSGVINHLYSFNGWRGIPSPDEVDGNRGEKLVLYAKGGTWTHVNAQAQIWDQSQSPVSDTACQQFRKKYLGRLFPVNESALFHNMNAQVVVITRDEKIVIARRKRGVLSAGQWTVSLEEQMLRWRQKDGFSDNADLFGCASRGAAGELGITVLPGYPKLLGFGLEFGNFTAAFVFLIRCAETFEGVARKWPDAPEADEAVAIDALPAQVDAINRILASDEWLPLVPKVSPLWNGPGDAASADRWHHTAKARLWACLRYVELGGLNE